MKILLDTSVLVAAMVETHQLASPWLKRVKNGADTGVVSVHTLAELYAILTTLPVKPRISPEVVQKLIVHNVLEVCEVISLPEEDYIIVIDRLSDPGIIGGATYDALILQAGLKANVDQVITLNQKDFCRVHPEFADRIVSP